MEEDTKEETRPFKKINNNKNKMFKPYKDMKSLMWLVNWKDKFYPFIFYTVLETRERLVVLFDFCKINSTRWRVKRIGLNSIKGCLIWYIPNNSLKTFEWLLNGIDPPGIREPRDKNVWIAGIKTSSRNFWEITSRQWSLTITLK